ncbi:hypothetical protein TrVE_jg2732 [Triparma verrucosa]|uniref:Hexose transporter 1 n=1 Tax=Triparma verrucosa TaxID=1606542 RepID=A0A9W7FMH2_9STRA|nr:hypothetical protein TrVE_jg2732 [Triparma verrucosa]
MKSLYISKSKSTPNDPYRNRLPPLTTKALTGGLTGGGSIPKPSSPSVFPPSYILSSSLSSLIGGYDTGVIAGALLYLTPALNLGSRPLKIGLIVTACTFGAILGSVITPQILTKQGRVPTLKISSVLFMLSAGLSGYSPTANYLICARFIAGIAMGAVSTAVPLYVSETSPKEERGRYATFPQFMISSGILVSYAVDLCILRFCGGCWRWMLGVAAVPSFAMMVGVFGLKESPRWLAGKGRLEEARSNLESIRKTKDVDVEFKSILKSVEAEAQASKHQKKEEATLSDLLNNKIARGKLVTVVALQAFQQLAGINAIVYFTPLILREAGVSSLTSKLLPDPNAASMLSTIIAYSPKIPALILASKLMDKMGRKKLLTTFTPVMSASLVSLALVFRYLQPGSALRGGIAVASIMVYGVTFCLSLGPIPSILSSEVFPQKYRSIGMSTSIFAQWTFNALVTLYFPVVQSKIGTENCLWLFAGMCAASGVFSKFRVEETKGKSLEEIGGN